MIKAQFTKVKTLYAKRKELKHIIERVLTSDDVLVLSVKDKALDVSGHTSSAAMNIYLLGMGTAMAFISTKETTPEITPTEFLSNLNSVALGHLEKRGYLAEPVEPQE